MAVPVTDLTDPDDCGPHAHLHEVFSPVILGPAMFAPGTVKAIMIDHRPVMLCFHDVIGHRVAALINQHGLLDVPDRMPATPAVVWPPPCPSDRVFGPGSC